MSLEHVEIKTNMQQFFENCQFNKDFEGINSGGITKILQ